MVRAEIAPGPDRSLQKAPTGIAGLDEVTRGGLPRGRPTLVCGSAGSGKTLLAIEFLVRGATRFEEPGVLVAFEETAADLADNVRSLGFDLDELQASGRLVVDHVHLDPSEHVEAGDYDLAGLFVRLSSAIAQVGAKRVVLDTIEALFGGLREDVLRAELRRLFRWLKDQGVTAIVTAERGEGQLTRRGLEEYVSDCVILLDHRVQDQVSTRRLRVVKYRGTTHGMNEYPFLIDEGGICVMPITALRLEHAVSDERVSTGVAQLDAMLGGGVYRGSTVLVSGTAGTGKTLIAAHVAHAACQRGERCLFFAFEESAAQILRNLRTVGLDLRPFVEAGRLRIVANRPTGMGLELHLVSMYRAIEAFAPSVAIADPITNLSSAGTLADAGQVLVRLVDLLKTRGVTAVLTSLTRASGALEVTDTGISSLVDTWLLLRDVEADGERHRALYVLKSRGTAHSNELRAFRIGAGGLELLDRRPAAGGRSA